jgi:hypothetical protein
MKKLQWIFCIVLVIIGVSSFDQKVSAATLSISGDIITDSNTGLEWLVMSRTVNKSPDSIKNGTDGDNLAALGWVHATIEQIDTLLLDAGMTGLFNGMNSNENFAAAKFLINLMGFTYEYQGEYGHSLSIQAFSAALGLSGLYTPVLIVGLEPNQVGVLMFRVLLFLPPWQVLPSGIGL